MILKKENIKIHVFFSELITKIKAILIIYLTQFIVAYILTS